jgi:very-short-patch-repair endonuclease
MAGVPPPRSRSASRPPLQGEGKPDTQRARELRRGQTEWERRLWPRLKTLKGRGFHFRRQVPIGPYYADFACHSARLVIELDGQQHDAGKDAARDVWFAKAGYRTLRFSNTQVQRDLSEVLHAIDAALFPPPRGEGDSPKASGVGGPVRGRTS